MFGYAFWKSLGDENYKEPSNTPFKTLPSETCPNFNVASRSLKALYPWDNQPSLEFSFGKTQGC